MFLEPGISKCKQSIQFNSLDLAIALGSFKQGKVLIRCVLRLFSLVLSKICVPIMFAQLENIKS